eukprot:4808804-Pleurochrysis_carterae.AAC.1
MAAVTSTVVAAGACGITHQSWLAQIACVVYARLYAYWYIAFDFADKALGDFLHDAFCCHYDMTMLIAAG